MSRRRSVWRMAGAICLLALSTVAVAPRAAVAQAGIAQATIPNVRVSHDGFPAHAEPSLAVNPRDPRNLLGAAMFIRGTHVVAGAFASFDGGRTWRDHGPLAMPADTTYSGDVTVAFDRRGAAFVAALVQAVWGDGVYVWRTDDGGHTFHPPVPVERGSFADHPGIAIDTTPGPGGSAVYVAWRTRAGLAFSRSVDAGRHFSPPRIIVPGDSIYVPAIASGPRGAVYVTYERQTGANSAQVEVVGSTDGGRRFGRPVVVGPMTDTLTPTPDVAVPTGPSVATDPRDGSVYLTYTGDRGAVLLARSRPVGRTWSAPVPVTASSRAGEAVTFQPHVVVDEAGGVDVTYFALAAGHVTEVLARSRSHGAGFDRPIHISSRPFNPALGVISADKGDKGSHWWIGDYQGLAAGGGLIHPFWNDTRTGRLEIFTAAVAATTRR